MATKGGSRILPLIERFEDLEEGSLYFDTCNGDWYVIKRNAYGNKVWMLIDDYECGDSIECDEGECYCDMVHIWDTYIMMAPKERKKRETDERQARLLMGERQLPGGE